MIEPNETIEIIDPASELGCNLHAVWLRNIAAIPRNSLLAKNLAQHQDPLSAHLLCRTPSDHYGLISQSSSGKSVKMLTEMTSIDNRFKQYTTLLETKEPVIFIGTGIGEPLLAYQDTLTADKQDVACTEIPFILIEPDCMRFHAALYFFDFTTILKSSSHCIHVGSPSLDCSGAHFNYNQATLVPAPLRRLDHEILLVQESLRAAACTGTILAETKPQGIYGQRLQLGPHAPSYMADNFRDNISFLQSYEHFHAPPSFLQAIEEIEIAIEVCEEGSVYLDISQDSAGAPQYIRLSPDQQEYESYTKIISEQNHAQNSWLLLGGGDGQLIELLFERTIFQGQWDEYGQIIYLVDPNALLFGILLHCCDLTPLLANNRLRIFTGEECQNNFIDYLKTDETARIPDRFLHCSHYLPSELDFYKNEVTAINQHTADEISRLSKELNDFYNSRDENYWQERYSGSTPLTVVGLSTKMSSFIQYCARDLIEGFSRDGHHAELLIEKDGLSCLRYSSVLKQLVELKPDLIFIIGHFRQELPWLPQKVPFMCWIQDMLPVVKQFQGFTLNRWDFPYSVNKHWAQSLKETNPAYAQTTINVLPVGFNEDFFHPLPGTQKKYDISYISHLFDIEKTFEFLRNGSPEPPLDPGEQQLISSGVLSKKELFAYYSDIVRRLDEMKLDKLTHFVTVVNRATQHLFAAIKEKKSITLPTQLYSYLTSGYTRLFFDVMNQIKIRPLRTLHSSGFNVATWGNNWRKYPDLESVSQGIAENSRQVNRIQNETRINLNNSGGVSLHMKALEIMASSAFMLSREIYHDGHPLTDYFKKDQDVVFFVNENDLPVTVEYFLSHERERRKIAQNGYNKVLEQFSYTHHARRIAADIQRNLPGVRPQ